MNYRLSFIACFIFTAMILAACHTIPDWRHVRVSPLTHISDDGIDNPVLRGSDVVLKEASAAGEEDIVADFVADPFLFYEDGVWYMFFEAAKRYRSGGTHWGRIGLATSHDGFRWAYDQIVLDDIVLDDDGMPVNTGVSLHHSYPQVIKHDGTYYMITESYRQHQIRFFQADRFPYDWRLVYTISECASDTDVHPRQCFEGNLGYLDPSIFRYKGKWWLYGSKDDYGYLYYSDRLLGDWQAHENNPVVRDSKYKARPGGRVIVYNHDRVIRIAQEFKDRYGQRVRAFDVTALSESDYLETEIHEGAFFCTDGGVFCETGTVEMCTVGTIPCEENRDVWNLCGMHQLDAWWTGDYWLLVTDGYTCKRAGDPGTWSIGIFISGPPTLSIKDPYLETERDPGPISPDTRVEQIDQADQETQIEVRPDRTP